MTNALICFGISAVFMAPMVAKPVALIVGVGWFILAIFYSIAKGKNDHI